MTFISLPNADRMAVCQGRLIVEAGDVVWLLPEDRLAKARSLDTIIGALALEVPTQTWAVDPSSRAITWIDEQNVHALDVPTGQRRLLPIAEFQAPGWRAPQLNQKDYRLLAAAIQIPYAPGLIYERAFPDGAAEANAIVWADRASGKSLGDAGVVLRGRRQYGFDGANKRAFVLDDSYTSQQVWRLSINGEPPVQWFVPRGDDEGDSRHVMHIAVSPRGGRIAAAWEHSAARAVVGIGSTLTATFVPETTVPAPDSDLEFRLRWSPNGKMLAIVEAHNRQTVVRLFDANLRPAGSRRVRADMKDACFSSDGRTLYVSEEIGLHLVRI